MNAKQFRDLLKNLQKMKCPSCGEIYQIDEIQFLGQIDGLFLMQMSCGKCQLPVWMNFMTNDGIGVKSQLILNDLKKKNYETVDKEEITADEIINFHNFMKKFDGNFKGKL